MKKLMLTAVVLLALPGLATAWHEPPPPTDLVSVPEAGVFWPYTGRDYSGSPTDPINLVFLGDADPRLIRQALLALDGNRTAFGFPDAFPFNCTSSPPLPRTAPSDTRSITRSPSSCGSGSACPPATSRATSPSRTTASQRS